MIIETDIVEATVDGTVCSQTVYVCRLRVEWEQKMVAKR